MKGQNSKIQFALNNNISRRAKKRLSLKQNFVPNLNVQFNNPSQIRKKRRMSTISMNQQLNIQPQSKEGNIKKNINSPSGGIMKKVQNHLLNKNPNLRKLTLSQSPSPFQSQSQSQPINKNIQSPSLSKFKKEQSQKVIEQKFRIRSNSKKSNFSRQKNQKNDQQSQQKVEEIHSTHIFDLRKHIQQLIQADIRQAENASNPSSQNLSFEQQQKIQIKMVNTISSYESIPQSLESEIIVKKKQDNQKNKKNQKNQTNKKNEKMNKNDKYQKCSAKFDIYQTYQLKFLLQKQKNQKIQKEILDFGCQVQSQDKGDYDSYLKLKQMYRKRFEPIQQIIASLSKQNIQRQDFQKNYKQFIQKISTYPEGQRQTRAEALGKDVNQAQKQVNDQFKILRKVLQQKQNYIMKTKLQFNSKLSSTLNCITTLSKVIGKKLSDLGLKNYKRIHERIQIFINEFSQRAVKLFKASQSIVTTPENQVAKLQQSFRNWTSLLYQNRFLTYNCMKQLQKVPQTAFTLFGCNNQSETDFQNLTEVQKLKQFITYKCPQCYQTMKKLRILKLKNQKCVPIVKVLQLLLKSSSNNSIFCIN